MFEHICSKSTENISYNCMHCSKPYILDCHTIIELLYTKDIKLCYDCYIHNLPCALWVISGAREYVLLRLNNCTQ